MTVEEGIRRNADGSITILRHKRPIRISAGLVGLSEIFGHSLPKPGECWTCKAQAFYHTKDRRGGPELIWVTYECGECGAKEEEPFD